jgi:hypothetical protein
LARKRSFIGPILVAAALAVGCTYGMFAERTQRFPYQLARTVLSVVRGEDAGRRDPGEPEAGRWRRQRAATDQARLTDEQRVEMERLESIGYLTGSEPAGERSGVTVHDVKRAEPGLNLVVSGHRPWAALMDMDGSFLHEWSLDFEDVWPDRDISDETTGDEYWRRVLLLDDGGIIAIHEGLGIVRLDRESRLVWAREGGYHHDLGRTGDGGFCVLDREASIVPRLSRVEPVLEDFIAYLDSEGNVVRRFSILEAVERSPHAAILARMDWLGDIFHTNTLEILDGRLAGKAPAFRAGNLLISILMLDTVAVVDHETEAVVWAIPGMWRQQHQPTVLGSGRMLVFDNKFRTETSRVVELDPFSQEVVWSYEGAPGRPFYSETCGSNQRLPSGNTLITESDYGRAFEVAPDGTIVWEYVNPHRAGPDGEFVATLFEVVRIPAAERPRWLD